MFLKNKPMFEMFMEATQMFLICFWKLNQCLKCLWMVNQCQTEQARMVCRCAASIKKESGCLVEKSDRLQTFDRIGRLTAPTRMGLEEHLGWWNIWGWCNIWAGGTFGRPSYLRNFSSLQARLLKWMWTFRPSEPFSGHP